jgi:integrase
MLTDAAIRKAKAGARAYRMADGDGLHLFVTPAGGKLWRLRYHYAGREKLLSLGPYPGVTLAEARAAREAARGHLRAGRDPGQQKALARAAAVASAATTFEAVAREWHAVQLPRWTARHAGDVIGSLEDAVFPTLGGLPIAEIPAPAVLAVLRAIEARPAIETARRVRQRMSAVFGFAIASGRAAADPAAMVAGALAPLVKGRQPAVVELAEARQVLRDAEAIPAHPVTRLALRLLALVVVRPGELRGARWEELPAGAEVWRVPAERMKMKRDHVAPLSRQAREVVEAVRRITGRGPLVFPSTRHAHRPMSENAIGYLLNRAGYHGRHVPHGWRATFSTVMNERYPRDREVIDLMLAHVPRGKVEAAYNRAEHLARRADLAQAWADLLLEGLPAAAELVTLARR